MSSLWNWLQPSLLPCAVQTASLIGPRAENQDNYLVIVPDHAGQATAHWLQNGTPQEAPRPDWSPRWMRLALMDGIGGHAHGREIAEAAALELLTMPPCTTLARQHRAMLNLHHKLQAQFANGGGQARSPGTTLVWAEIDRRRHVCNLLHVGDSRAWLWSGSAWQKLTRDHTALEFRFRDGLVDHASYLMQLDKPEHRIAQALGYGSWGVQQDGIGNEILNFTQDLRIDTAKSLSHWALNHADIHTIDLPQGAILLLSSDGLWNAAKVHLPNPTVNMVPGVARTLAQKALDAGGQDNTTVIIGTFSHDI